MAESLSELALLVTTAGGTVVGQTSQRPRHVSPATLVGHGKLQEIADERVQHPFDTLVVDMELSPTQQRNLEEFFGKATKVLDRTALILDIFAQRAHTREAQLQVELAQLEYLLPRLAGMFTFFSRSAGAVRGATGIATRGPGETQLETDRRHVRQRIDRLEKELNEVRRTRHLHRLHRERQGVPVVSLVGYTNTGKSTLMNRLTSAGVLAEDRLFATLEPTLRRYILPSGQEIVLSDTVGFIQKLPPKLVAAFRATLEELEEAALLLLVVDVSDPNHAERYRTVLETLEELKLLHIPRLIVLNKVDLVSELPLGLIEYYPGSIAVSAYTGIGLETLTAAITDAINGSLEEVTVLIPYSKPEFVQIFHRRGSVEWERYSTEGTILRGRLPSHLVPRFERFFRARA
ncbi:MAG: GTPase HflX [Chloroflexi bacterium]|nr:GTPase HflX [Chloroflexota bacterium]